MDVRAAIVAERRELVELLSGLDAEQWATPTLCEGWTVHDVVAHLATPYVEHPARTVLEMIRHRSVARAMDAMVRRVGERSDDDLVAAITDHIDDVFVPPGAGVGAPLTDVIVHGADIRVPLGFDSDRPADRVVRALEFVTSWRASPIFLPRRRLRGIALSATDVDWSVGDGEPMRGRAIDLLLAALGRRVVLPELEGSGVDVLRSRLA